MMLIPQNLIIFKKKITNKRVCTKECDKECVPSISLFHYHMKIRRCALPASVVNKCHGVSGLTLFPQTYSGFSYSP